MTDQTNDLNEQLSAMFSAVDKQYTAAKDRENKRREKGELFNIFNIIKLRTEEVRLHSALLAELLYPKGSHGAGSLFLNAFLEIIGLDEGYINYDLCSAEIKERYIGSVTETTGGIIDIIIEDGHHAIIIENKIYAPDQNNQLLRYYNYAKTEFTKGFKLLYLTLNGDEPNKCSLGGKELDYQPISYKDEIIKWLERCVELAKDKENARIIINQYNNLVKELTSKDMDRQYIEQLKDIVLAPKNITAVGEILRIQDELFDEILERYVWQPLKEFAKSKGMEYDNDDDGAWIYKPEWEHYGIAICPDKCYSWGDMHVGVWCYNEPNRVNKLHLKDQKRLSCLKEKPVREAPYWPYGWEYLEIRNWNFDNIVDIINGKVSDEIKKKFEEILTEIEERNLRMP